MGNSESGRLTAFIVALLIHGGAVWLVFGLKPAERPVLPRVENFRMVDLPVRPPSPPPPPPSAAPPPSPAPPPEPVPLPVPEPKALPVIKPLEKPKPQPVRKPREVPAPIVEAPPVPEAAQTEAPPMSPVPAAEPYVPPSSDAAYLRNPPPAYPLAARRRGVEGLVRLTVEVGADGLPLSVVIAQGSGYAMLDEAALAAVRNWRFEPAKRGNRPVAARVEVPVRFKLEN